MKFVAIVAIILSSLGVNAQQASNLRAAREEINGYYKVTQILSTIKLERPAADYLRFMNINRRALDTYVSETDFKNLFVDQNLPLQLSGSLRNGFASKVSAKVNAFIMENAIRDNESDAPVLRRAEILFEDMMVLQHLQVMISERQDLEVFGAHEIAELNTAITKLVRQFYDKAESYLSRANPAMAARMRESFLRHGLNVSGSISEGNSVNSISMSLSYVLNFNSQKISDKLYAPTCRMLFGGPDLFL